MEKQLQVWALKKTFRPVLLDTLAAIYVTCNMFLMHCFDFSKSNNDFSFQKVHFFKTKIIKTAEKRALLVGRGDGWLSCALQIGLEACELPFCTMRLNCKHTFIDMKLTGSQIRAFVFFIVILEHFSGVCVLVFVKIW